MFPNLVAIMGLLKSDLLRAVNTVWMGLSAVYFKPDNLSVGEPGSGEHLVHRDLENFFGPFDHELLIRKIGGAAGVAGVIKLMFALQLISRELDLVHVGDDDKVAQVHGSGEGGLVLSHEDGSHLAGQPSQDLVLGVNPEPLPHDFLRFGKSGLIFKICGRHKS